MQPPYQRRVRASAPDETHFIAPLLNDRPLRAAYRNDQCGFGLGQRPFAAIADLLPKNAEVFHRGGESLLKLKKGSPSSPNSDAPHPQAAVLSLKWRVPDRS